MPILVNHELHATEWRLYFTDYIQLIRSKGAISWKSISWQASLLRFHPKQVKKAQIFKGLLSWVAKAESRTGRTTTQPQNETLNFLRTACSLVEMAVVLLSGFWIQQTILRQIVTDKNEEKKEKEETWNYHGGIVCDPVDD